MNHNRYDTVIDCGIVKQRKTDMEMCTKSTNSSLDELLPLTSSSQIKQCIEWEPVQQVQVTAAQPAKRKHTEEVIFFFV